MTDPADDRVFAYVTRPANTPSPRIAAMLSLAMLVTGIALGAAAGPNAPSTLASSAGGVIALVAPPAAAVTETTAATPPEVPSVPDVPEVTAPAEPPVLAADPEPATPAATTTTPADSDKPAGDDEEDAAGQPKPPAIKHLWLFVLADQGYQQVWGTTSASSYFSKDLRALGTLLPRYYATGHGALVDGVALLSGQEAGAQLATAESLPDQLTAAGLTWKAYLADAVAGAPPASASCTAPAGARNPFVFFKSVSQDPVCATNVVGTARLAADLASSEEIPAFSYIAPAAADLQAIQPFVSDAITKIMATAQFAEDGLIVVTSDQAPETGPRADAREGGGRVGALLISPLFTPGAQIAKRYDHISLLRTIENLFGLEHLGAASGTAHKAFGPPPSTG